jgi:twitching motility protein PilT
MTQPISNDSLTQATTKPVEQNTKPLGNDDTGSVQEQHHLMRNIPINNAPPTIVGSNYVETIGPNLQTQINIPAQSPEIPVQVLTKETNVPINIIEKPNPVTINIVNEEIIVPTPEEMSIYKEQLDDLLTLAVEKNASDLHIAVNYPPMLRIDGSLVNVGTQDMNKKQAYIMLTTILPKRLFQDLNDDLDVDLSYEHKSGNRFRVNIFNNKGTLAGAFRFIPSKIKSISDLSLPQICYDLIQTPQGLILFTGPTGSGKSTSIAAMIQEINLNYNKHIITIEDPIEYIFPKSKAMVNQRELGVDTTSWTRSLRELLRQDPNVVLVGEMRDFETISATITVAETGHLVFATLHTNSASQTIDRIIDVFPEGQQNQIRSQLANVIVAVIAQRLVPINKGGRKAIFEVMVATPGIKNAIREGKTYQIDNMIQTNADLGMITLEKSLVQAIRNGDITVEQGVNYTSKPDELISLLNGGGNK